MRIFALMLTFLLTLPSLAADIRITNAWVRAPAPGQPVVGGFMDITSNDSDAVLVSASTSVAEIAEMHEMSMKDGVMSMRPVPYIRLPKAQTVKLAPGGLHLMLIDLKKPLKAGDRVPLTLKVLSGRKTTLHEAMFDVRDPLASARH